MIIGEINTIHPVRFLYQDESCIVKLGRRRERIHLEKMGKEKVGRITWLYRGCRRYFLSTRPRLSPQGICKGCLLAQILDGLHLEVTGWDMEDYRKKRDELLWKELLERREKVVCPKGYNLKESYLRRLMRPDYVEQGNGLFARFIVVPGISIIVEEKIIFK